MSEFWENLKDKDQALDAILTGYKGDTINMPVYENVMSHLNKTGSILDFGCGAGRNVRYLSQYYHSVYAYDYPNMLEFVPRETLELENVTFSSDLDYICSGKYDEILFSLVLQHIHPNELRDILRWLSPTSPRFIIHSRTWVDFTLEEIMPILEEFLKVEKLDYQKDPNSDRSDHFIGVFVTK